MAMTDGFTLYPCGYMKDDGTGPYGFSPDGLPVFLGAVENSGSGSAVEINGGTIDTVETIGHLYRIDAGHVFDLYADSLDDETKNYEFYVSLSVTNTGETDITVDGAIIEPKDSVSINSPAGSKIMSTSIDATGSKARVFCVKDI